MLSWLESNIGTICVSLFLAAVVAMIAAKLIKDKKEGKSTCGCGCSHCAMGGECHKNIKR